MVGVRAGEGDPRRFRLMAGEGIDSAATGPHEHTSLHSNVYRPTWNLRASASLPSHDAIQLLLKFC
jgi:hypothetical protein